MANQQEFLSLYNELDESLRSYYGNNNYSSSVMVRLINELTHSGYYKYEEYGRKLNMIRIIRNDLVHDLDMNSQNIISITDETIIFLRQLLEIVKHPQTAFDIATPFKKLDFIWEKDNPNVLALIKDMREKGFTQLPILGENNRLVGVFSANVLFDYLKTGNSNLADVHLKDVAQYLPTNKHFSESYYFVARNLPVQSLSTMIYEAMCKNEKPAMIFITQSGHPNEPLQGIAVPSDVARAMEN